MAASSVICPEMVSRVSSVLNREAKQFGKKHMFDGNEETCWNSDQGSIQWLTLEFPHTVKVSQVQIQFQGGFASQKCVLLGCSRGEELSQIAEVYPEDTNSLQRCSGGRVANFQVRPEDLQQIHLISRPQDSVSLDKTAALEHGLCDIILL
ncbi:nuclear receptor 2C2-associated protein isoform X1 [Eublepharis macularius]|uniref:Nuclear receptor 2C2-associated protein isoform X1 n=1 Tax=Eublepharis macularius TaxID=481883 RepID=A0AA97JC23_EUBMA|nr:nuclear receptor 2C2-associated protein isoform X1 [Eublepharis macularius]XP_054835727.1 nuclear receptor 2C2-associated protein isoform X1 [Eublepharis macularius]XP_054835728.1 nuclear receptor 2C2-associated protein isoform X1 [Eublepharis macularius]XP_054835729.1 nuclear receptor 2C2-associated protein isoform X1 [Eublepharis macularius]XP_054835731.1 nuclear receptor 2C2-associated protein isoform X1 [Eublepharis macularius]XP_054835732.1 nuclear receptor 2C2-associated protein isofo